MAKNKQKKETPVSSKKSGVKISARPISKRYRKLFKDNLSRFEQIDARLQSLRWKTRVIERPQNARERILKDKYLKELEVESQAAQLLNRFAEIGLSKAAAYHAIKSDKVDQLLNKWTPRLTEFKRVQEALKRGRMGELLKDEQRL